MTENRRQILEMLAAGKITADEADRLMSALYSDGNGDLASTTGDAYLQNRKASTQIFARDGA